jgi:hypothetical protein
MQTVIETPTYLADREAAGVSFEDAERITSTISANPTMGDVIVGTGGARKVRIAGRGKGKSGGYRVITCYVAQDIPVFLLALISKGERANISQAERNELKSELSEIAEDYRAGVRAKVKELRRRK